MRLIIDTDAGIDDAQAILLALSHPDATVAAVTTVTGNVHVDWVTRNIFTILAVAGADAPVYRGAERPLLPGFWELAVRAHGDDGLGNYRQRPKTDGQPEPGPAAAGLVALANAAPGAYTLVALGPLTNIALACRLDPAFPDKIKALVFMGGTTSALGNTQSVTADFNMVADPEAALIVLDAFAHATMLPWETALGHPFAWEEYDALTTFDTPVGRFFTDITYSTTAELRRYQQPPGFHLPDALAMAVALNPDVITASEQHYVTVETQGRHTRGQTVIDHFGLLRKEPNVTVVGEVDLPRVVELYRRMLAARPGA